MQEVNEAMERLLSGMPCSREEEAAAVEVLRQAYPENIGNLIAVLCRAAAPYEDRLAEEKQAIRELQNMIAKITDIPWYMGIVVRRKCGQPARWPWRSARRRWWSAVPRRSIRNR